VKVKIWNYLVIKSLAAVLFVSVAWVGLNNIISMRGSQKMDPLGSLYMALILIIIAALPALYITRKFRMTGISAILVMALVCFLISFPFASAAGTWFNTDFASDNSSWNLSIFRAFIGSLIAAGVLYSDKKYVAGKI